MRKNSVKKAPKKVGGSNKRPRAAASLLLPAACAALALGQVSFALAQTASAGGAGLVLPEVSASGATPGAAGGAANGESARGAYTVQKSSAATKTDTPLIDTPISITVIPRAVLDDQQVITTKDALINVPSVQTSSLEFYDVYMVRGFEADFYRNGLRMQALVGTVNPAFAERIEVIKGPQSVAYGRIEPGGFINTVTKLPQAVQKFSIEQQVGSWSQVRTVLDATGPVPQTDNTLLYRVIGVYDGANSWVNFDQKDNKAVAATLSWLPNGAFTGNLQFEYYNMRYTAPNQQLIPVVNGQVFPLPRSFTLGDPVLGVGPGLLPTTQSRALIGLDWTYAIDASWQISQKFHFWNSDETQYLLFANSFENTDTLGLTQLSRGGWLFPQWNRQSIANNFFLSGKFNTFGFDHKLLIGFDYYQYREVEAGYCCDPVPAVPNLNIYNPIYGNIAPQAILNLPKNFTYRLYANDVGVYAQDQISLNEQLFLLLGGRYDLAYQSASVDPFAGYYPTVGTVNAAFSPRVGLLFKLLPTLSMYGTYSQSFGQNNGIAAQGGALAPQKAEQWEGGVKADLLDGRLLATLAVFSLSKTNIPYSISGVFTALTGAANSQGVELEFQGAINDNLKVIGGFTYDYAVVTGGNPDLIGNALFGVPRSAFSLWSVFDTNPFERTGWQFGGGVYYRGDRPGNPSNVEDAVLPAYTRFDAMASYRTEVFGYPIKFQLNVQNFTDTHYFDRAQLGGTGPLFTYGAPRTFLGSVKMMF